MVQASCSFRRRLPLCTSLYRHMEFQYRRKKRISCIFSLANFCPPPATSTGSNPSLVRIGSFHNSSLVCSSYAHNWARGKMRYMADAARYTANCMQHATLHATLPKCCQGQHFRPGQKNWLVCLFHCLKSLKTPKCCPCQHFVSVACSVACSVAWDCHATLGYFHKLRKKDSASSLLLVRQWFDEMPALLCPACAAIWSNLSAPGSQNFYDFEFNV